ncbi:MAG: hypothetical protein Q9220_005507, partial [cf. Caloplaca sp. 1 TL-2023]
PSNVWVSLQKLWEKYERRMLRDTTIKGEIFKITVLGQQIVFIGSVALCEELCDETRFRKFVGGPIVEIRNAVHASLFTAFANEPIWDVHHRIIAPQLTPHAVSTFFPELRDCAAELISTWRNQDQKKTAPFLILDALNRLDLETTTLCFYGRKLNNLTPSTESPMIKAMDGATSEAMKRPNRPKLLNWLLYNSKFQKDCTTMRKYAAETLAYRRANPQPERRDMLFYMLDAKDPSSGKPLLSDEQILDEIVTMPIGSSTAPCVLASAIYYLLRSPACITTAREEIDRVIGDKEFSYENLEQLPYCAAIVRESMRLSAAAPGFNIEPLPGTTTGPVTIGGGKYQVPATQTMIIVLHGVNRDPAVYSEPEEFQPERMMGERFERLPAGAKKFFGNGKRVCVGKEWAWMWLVTVLVELLRGVDFEMGDKGYVFRQDGWFNLRPVGFEVVVKVRG